MDGLPDWEAVRDLMLARKPPINATVYAIGKPTAKVLADGRGAWWIDEGADRVLQPEDGRAVFIGEGRFELVASHGGVHTRGWIKPALEPWRYELERATGRVVEGDSAAGREAVVVDIDGLKGSVTFRVWVDREVGIILRMERADEPAPLLVLDDVRVGTVSDTEPT